MRSAFPHSFLVVSFAFWACLCLLACCTEFVTNDETQTGVELMVYYSLKDLIPKEIYFPSIFFLKIFKYTENLKET